MEKIWDRHRRHLLGNATTPLLQHRAILLRSPIPLIRKRGLRARSHQLLKDLHQFIHKEAGTETSVKSLHHRHSRACLLRRRVSYKRKKPRMPRRSLNTRGLMPEARGWVTFQTPGMTGAIPQIHKCLRIQWSPHRRRHRPEGLTTLNVLYKSHHSIKWKWTPSPDTSPNRRRRRLKLRYNRYISNRCSKRCQCLITRTGWLSQTCKGHTTRRYRR